MATNPDHTKFPSTASDNSLQSSQPSIQKTGLPRIPLNLRAHKLPLAITAALLVSFAGIFPVALYFILRYAAHTDASIYVAVPSAIFGVYSIVPLCTRTWNLFKANSTCRPLGASKWYLDYFQWNFITIFCIVTVVISVGASLAGSESETTRKNSLRIVSMSLSIIIIMVCMQMVIIFTALSLNPATKYPFRISSMTTSEVARPAVYTIIEDVVAVDGKGGEAYRRVFNERYAFSEEIRGLLLWADGVWGFSGVALGAALIIVIWVVNDERIGFVLGWIVPWLWAFTMTFLTIQRTKSATRKENDHYFRA